MHLLLELSIGEIYDKFAACFLLHCLVSVKRNIYRDRFFESRPMLRRCSCRFQQQQQQQINSQQPVLQIDSAFGLLRMCYRSIDITVKSRHGRNFLKKRLITQWRDHRGEQDPEKQRFLMDHAASFLQALHTPKNPDPSKIIVFQLSRVEALKEKERQEQLEAASSAKKQRA